MQNNAAVFRTQETLEEGKQLSEFVLHLFKALTCNCKPFSLTLLP